MTATKRHEQYGVMGHSERSNLISLYSEFVRACDLCILKGAGGALRRLPPDLTSVKPAYAG